MLILTFHCLGAYWVLIIMTVSKANDVDLVFYSVCITLPPICQGFSFYPDSSCSPVQQFSRGRLRAGNCCGGVQEGRIVSAAAALTKMASPGAVLFEKFPCKQKRFPWLLAAEVVTGCGHQWWEVLTAAEILKKRLVLYPQIWPWNKVDPAGIVRPQNRKRRETLSFLWPHDATGVQAAYSQACHSQDSGSSMPVPSPMAFALLAIISAILAHFSHRLSLYLPCPWGEIWLHLSNKLENWAIIERIRSMWTVYLTYAGQKAQRSIQN